MEVGQVRELPDIAVSDATGQGILYLVPTPIGNLEDMTFRALRVLQAVDFVAAEDTRHTGRLLQHFAIDKPLLSYHEHNKEERGADLIARLQEGKSIAVVSDAGMPAISDPGADMVRLAIEAGLTVVPLPGANAALTALVASGLDTTEFTFVGFLPKRKGHRQETLERLATYTGTLIFYEAPHRIEEVLMQMYTILGNRPCTLGRELTKKFETFTRTTLGALASGEMPLTLRGEFVIIVSGAEALPIEEESTEVVPIWTAVADLMAQGVAKKEAMRQVAKARNLSRREVYQAVEAAREE